MFVSPDTQKSHPWRSSRAVLARDGPATRTSISPCVASPPFVDASLNIMRSAAQMFTIYVGRPRGSANLKRSVAVRFVQIVRAARPTSGRTDDVEQRRERRIAAPDRHAPGKAHDERQGWLFCVSGAAILRCRRDHDTVQSYGLFPPRSAEVRP
jgi:hypothetical protein